MWLVDHVLGCKKAIDLTNEAMGFERHASLLVPDRIPEGVCLFAMGAHKSNHLFYRIGCDNDAKPNAHVIDLEHFCLTNLAVSLNEVKNGRHRRQLFNDIAHIGRDARQVEQAIARNVHEGLDGEPLLEQLHHLADIYVGWAQEFFAKGTFQGWE